MWILLAMSAARADCSLPDAPRRYAEALARSRLALEAGELERFADELGRAGTLLGCLDEPVPREQAAEVHRLMSAAALLDGRDQEALDQLRAALTLSPPEGDGGGWLPPPGRGWWVVDGARSQRYPGHPYILQRADESGRIVETRYVSGPPERGPEPLLDPGRIGAAPLLDPGLGGPAPLLDPVPAGLYAAGEAPPSGTGDAADTEGWHVPEPAPGWLLVAGGSALLSGGLYALAARRADSFYDLSTPQEDLSLLRRQTNTLVAGSAVFGLTAAGALGGAFAVRW